jgi:hypothetical protein
VAKPLAFPEYPNAERFARSFGRASVAGLCLLVAGLVLGVLTHGVARAMWLGAAVPFGLWWFVVFWLIQRRSLRKLGHMREEATHRSVAASDSS